MHELWGPVPPVLIVLLSLSRQCCHTVIKRMGVGRSNKSPRSFSCDDVPSGGDLL